MESEHVGAVDDEYVGAIEANVVVVVVVVVEEGVNVRAVVVADGASVGVV